MANSKADPRDSRLSASWRHLEFSPQALAGRLAQWPVPGRYVVLVSGGCDSMVLLHAMAEIRDRLAAPLVALHFDHGLAGESAEWSRFVESRAQALGVPFSCQELDLQAGAAAETRARQARYARLKAWMQPGDGCLTAHHADDQAETFLLHALRGSGTTGLSAMPEWAGFGTGWLGRPLFDWSRPDLQAWAERHGVAWIEDPANTDVSVPRNWLRLKVWPALAEAWPAVARTLGRAARLCAEADAVLTEVAHEDLLRLQGGKKDRLPVEPLLSMSPPRRRNVLRHWLRDLDLPAPEAGKLLELESVFVLDDPGGSAALNWPGACVRRYRGELFAYPPWPPCPTDRLHLVPGETLDLGYLGRITLERDSAGPLEGTLVSQDLTIRFRAGGERVRPARQTHHRTLKRLFQEQAVLPWMRDRIPLLYAGDVLAAVPGVVEASDAFAGRGWRLDWSGGPPLH